MEFCKAFNAQTSSSEGLLPVTVTVYADRSFDLQIKTPPTSYLLKKAAGVEKGSGTTPRSKAGKITEEQAREIAQRKLEDLNTDEIDAALMVVRGTARSMGIDIEG